MEQTGLFLSCLDTLTGDAETSLKYMLKSVDTDGVLNVPLGITKEGKVISRDLAKASNILISGTTGSGKTAFIQSLLGALMLQYNPEKVHFVIFDSKVVDYGMFNGIPNLLIPVITDKNKMAGAISWINVEVNRRIKMKMEGHSLDEKPDIFFVLDDYFALSNDKSVINDLYDILRLGRSVKIHCIISTSTPTAKVIPTELKVNIPYRIAFSTASKSESRVILDMNGAETLSIPGEVIIKWQHELLRCQCLHVSDDDMQIILKHHKS